MVKNLKKSPKTFKKGIDKAGGMWYNAQAAEKTAEITMKNPEKWEFGGAFGERIGEGDSERCDERKSEAKKVFKNF